MNDMDWKTWGLIVVVAMGMTFEAIKRLPTASEKWTADQLRFKNAQTSPYQVKHKRADGPPAMLPMNALPMPKAAKVAGQTTANAAVNRATIEKFLAANKTHTSDFNHTVKGAEGKDEKAKAKKKKDDDEYEIIIDPRTGKRYKRKKKKVAKVEEPKVELVKEEPKKEEPKVEEDIEAVMKEAIVSGGLPPLKDKADTPNVDIEEWKRRLLARPDAAETRRFIDHFNNGLVSTEIFYKIIALMLEDSRPQMKELGVLCAGSTPSVLSFQVLADVVKEERSGSTLRKYSESFLSTYSALGRLILLDRMLKSPANSFVAVQAIKQLDAAANNYLAPSKHKPPKSTANSAGAAGAKGHSNSPYFLRFVTILQGLIRNPDSSVNEPARLTLASINSLMSLSSAPATAPPPSVPGSGSPVPPQASTQP
jgi:hypothetical protein